AIHHVQKMPRHMRRQGGSFEGGEVRHRVHCEASWQYLSNRLALGSVPGQEDGGYGAIPGAPYMTGHVAAARCSSLRLYFVSFATRYFTNAISSSVPPADSTNRRYLPLMISVGVRSTLY